MRDIAAILCVWKSYHLNQPFTLLFILIAKIALLLLGCLGLAILLSLQKSQEVSQGGSHHYLILKGDVPFESMSNIGVNDVILIHQEIQSISPEIQTRIDSVLPVTLRSQGFNQQVTLRGVKVQSRADFKNIELHSGRFPVSAENEVIVTGTLASAVNRSVGDAVEIGGAKWNIVGVGVADGRERAFEIVTTSSALHQQFGNSFGYSSVNLFSQQELSVDSLLESLSNIDGHFFSVSAYSDYSRRGMEGVVTSVSVIWVIALCLASFGATISIGTIDNLLQSQKGRIRVVLYELGFSSLIQFYARVIEYGSLGGIAALAAYALFFVLFDGTNYPVVTPGGALELSLSGSLYLFQVVIFVGVLFGFLLALKQNEERLNG